MTITFNRKKFVIIIAIILVAVVVLGAIGVSLLINPQNNESNPTATPANTSTSTPNPTETATPSPTTQTSELLKATMTPTSLGLLNGAKTDISVYVTYNGNPVTDAAVKFTSDNGGTFTTTQAQTTAGYYKTTFTAPNIETMTICTVTATATAGVFGAQATVQITVTPTLTYSKIGSIQLLVTDQEGMPLGNAVVSSVVQPDGMGALMDLTNSTGQVTFRNLMTGIYTFRILKDGYAEMNQTITFEGTPMTLSIKLPSNSPTV